MADDRLSGWQGKQVEDFYDLIGEELVRETELNADYVDHLAESGVSVTELAESSRTWRYGHVIVDEAQDLSPMQWRMVQRRTSGGAITIVGDIAQRSAGIASSWDELLGPVYPNYSQHDLTINYRSPSEVNEVASRIADRMDLEVSKSTPIRTADREVDWIQLDSPNQISTLIGQRLNLLSGGDRLLVVSSAPNASEIHTPPSLMDPQSNEGRRSMDPSALTVLSPVEAKGLEFDDVLVLLDDYLVSDEGLSDLFVSVTRATRSLAVCSEKPIPEWLRGT